MSPALLVVVLAAVGAASAATEQSHGEQLLLSHLPDGRTLAHFEFTTTWAVHPLHFSSRSNVHHYGFFPKTLAEVISAYQVQELHLALTQGKWRTRTWGFPPVSTPPGAELWTWFLPHANADVEWPGLINAMSGLLCAHLNFIGPTSTYEPKLSFRPQGPIIGNLSSSQLRYAASPRESVCTENFTPWTKLLPCGTSAGLGSLFSALKLYDSDYHSLALHFTPVCLDPYCAQVSVRLLQTVTVVFPPALDHKGYIDWSLQSLFSKRLTSSCPVADSSQVVLVTGGPADLQVTVEPQPSWTESKNDEGRERDWLVYDVPTVIGAAGKLDLTVKSKEKFKHGMPSQPLIYAQRFLRGSGHEWGGLHTEVTNSHPSAAARLLYLDMVPWFCRVYIHTLNTTGASVLHQSYRPAKDRQRPHTLELLLSLPPRSTATISVEFSRAFLKWTEHPPDAHHGFYINSAVLTAVLSADCPNCTATEIGGQQGDTLLRLHTEPLLVSLPTPDFSMPYNVICFVCTVIAIGFGSIFNLTTRTLEPVDPDKPQGLVARAVARLRGLRSARINESAESTQSTIQ